MTDDLKSGLWTLFSVLWLAAKIAFFLLASMHGFDVIVVAYQQF